jgi:rod shape-determining protein MreD
MNRRHVVLFLAGYAGLVLLAPLRHLLPWDVPFPDLVLLVVLYAALALKGSTAAGAAVAVGLGYLSDLFTGAPKGLYSLSLGVCYFAVRGMSARLYVRGKLAQAFVAFVVCMATGIMQVALTVVLGQYSFIPLFKLALGTALATGVCAPAVFWALWSLDRKVAPEVTFEGIFK